MKARKLVASLTMSASAFVGLLVYEGYKGDAYIPTAGDVPTVGFGTTKNPDGSPITSDAKTDPVRAVIAAHKHLSTEESRFRDSIPNVALHQGEYDIYADFVYQYGIGNWLASSMRRNLLAGDYRMACESLLLWRYQAGRDCKLPINWGPQGCKGVWTRQQDRYKKCASLQ